jgi:hypothetical protein
MQVVPQRELVVLFRWRADHLRRPALAAVRGAQQKTVGADGETVAWVAKPNVEQRPLLLRRVVDSLPALAAVLSA